MVISDRLDPDWEKLFCVMCGEPSSPSAGWMVHGDLSEKLAQRRGRSSRQQR
jgi:hypothetical protein